MDKYLKNLITGGENQKLDFKYCVSDSRKIARTLVAFSNSDGGKLLIGVKDNGRISGIKSEEEIYMVDTAAQLFCRPEISYKIRQHTAGLKTLLEVEVIKGEKRPYQAQDENGRWLTYFRHKDQNLIANKVLLLVWKKQMKETGVIVKFGAAENSLMNHLSEKGSVTLSKFRKIAGISSRRAEAILANLIILKIITMNFSDRGCTYELNPEVPLNLSQ